MFKSIKKNKIKTLEPNKPIINNDIDIKEYDVKAILTIILIPSIFLVSMKTLLLIGYI